MAFTFKDRRSRSTIMKKSMDIRHKCKYIIKYILIKITNNIEKKQNNPKITIFKKLCILKKL